MTDADYCYRHNPETREEARQASQAGGRNKRKEAAIREIYGILPLDTEEGILRIFELAVDAAVEVKEPEKRARLFAYIGQGLTSLYGKLEMAREIRALQASVAADTKADTRSRLRLITDEGLGEAEGRR